MKSIMLFLLTVTMFVNSFAQIDSTALNHVFGKKGTVSGRVYKVAFPRSDLQVKVDDFNVAPALALGTWVGIIQMQTDAMMMGDLVLLDAEVPRVVNKLMEENIEVTAIHNHLINEKPAIKYVHFHGRGDAVKLAQQIKNVLKITATPLSAPVSHTQKQNIDWSKVTAILGPTGKQSETLLQYSFPRNEKLTESGMEMPASMGMTTAINFQMDGNRAAITGDFVLMANEVNPVMKALTENGISPTAIHNHMLNEEPRLFMMHFWAVGNVEKLAKGIKVALDKTNSKK